MNPPPLIITLSNPSILEPIYIEACLGFRDAKSVSKLSKYANLCKALEDLYPTQTESIRKKVSRK